MANSLRKNFSWSLLGNVIYALCQWMVLVIIARLGDARDVGIYSLALAISAPIMLFVGMNMRVAICTDRRCDFRVQDYVVLRVYSVLFGLALILFIAVLGYKNDTYIIQAIIWVALAKVVESFSDVCYGYFQKSERNDLISKSLMLKGVTTAVLLAPAYYYFRSLAESTAVIFLVWLTVLLVFDISRLKCLLNSQVGDPLQPLQIFRLVKAVLPLGFVAVLDSLTPNVARYAIELFFGLEQLGYFSAIAYLMVAGGTVAGALGYAATPRMAKHFVDGELSSFVRVGVTTVLMGSGVGISGLIAAVFYGQELLGFLYGEKYKAYQQCLVIVMLASTLWYAAGLTGCMLNAARRFGHQLLINLLSLSAVIISVINFGRDAGLNGIAWSLTIGMAMKLMASLCLVYFHILKTDY